MITNICLLLEVLSILVCLHCLYGERFKLNITTTSFLSIYMIIMAAINYYHWPSVLSMLIHPFIALYCGIRFGFKWRAIIINSVLYLIIIGGIQLLVAICYEIIFSVSYFNNLDFSNNELLIINSSVLFIILTIIPRVRINRLSVYLQDKERFLLVFLLFCIILIVSSVINYKLLNGLDIYQYLPLFIGISLFCILVGQLSKYKIRSKEIETELKMHQLYSESFQSLIEEIRMRQHEFDNHINTIYSLHYTCKSYNELVKAQNEYSQIILKENRHNKLLKVGNPLLIGFLYGKFVEMEKLGIKITYQIRIKNLDVGVPVYRLVEILGNLIKNAIEVEPEADQLKEVHVNVIQKDEKLSIEVRNKSRFIEYNEIESFFKRGFSRKGNNRGLGLYNVKRICNEYSLKICCDNKNIDEDNWFSFTIHN